MEAKIKKLKNVYLDVWNLDIKSVSMNYKGKTTNRKWNIEQKGSYMGEKLSIDVKPSFWKNIKKNDVI